MIGNAVDAELIRDYLDLKRASANRRIRIPDGWKILGKGTFRAAFLSPDGVVYKVELTYSDFYGQSNRGEFRNIVRILTNNWSHEAVVIPRSTFYELDGRGVMAMEYFDGESPEFCYGEERCRCEGKCIEDTLFEIGWAFRMQDVHNENIVWIPEQNRYALFDLGA